MLTLKRTLPQAISAPRSGSRKRHFAPRPRQASTWEAVEEPGEASVSTSSASRTILHDPGASRSGTAPRPDTDRSRPRGLVGDRPRPAPRCSGAAALRSALDRLRADTRQLAGAAALVGDVFTGDDLLRLHVALHGGPEGSERTFRRRIQELRDSGVLRPVRDTEVAALRLRVPRFRSPAGTGGRPPELLRYSGAGGEDEQLAALRARRAG